MEAAGMRYLNRIFEFVNGRPKYAQPYDINVKIGY